LRPARRARRLHPPRRPDGPSRSWGNRNHARPAGAAGRRVPCRATAGSRGRVSGGRLAAGEAETGVHLAATWGEVEVVEGERLTEKQADALREELAELEGPRRTEVVAAIKKAREFGDLSENFEYHAAKNEQGLLEARIRVLRARLDHAEIVDHAGGDEGGIGSILEIDPGGGQSLLVENSAVGGPRTGSARSPPGVAPPRQKIRASV